MSISSISAAGIGTSVAKNSSSSSSASAGSFDALLGQGTTSSAANSSPSTAAGGSYMQDPAVKAFMDYMNEPIGKRMEDAWLKAHHLSEADLKSMSPEKRAAIEKEMAKDIEDEIKRKMEATNQKTGSSV